MNTIGPEALADRLDAGDDLFVLDIRPESDYRAGHIDGSHNAPVYDAVRGGDAAALDAHLDAVPGDAEVVTVCKMGVVAKRATARLGEQGYEARTLAGGMRRWRGYQANSLGYRLSSFVRGLLP
ncbi:MAG: rhodanese-like domain-containing protein [Halobacteriaceae archaeon]